MRARQRVAKQISAHASYTVMKRAVVAVEPGCPAHSQLPGSADVFALLYLGNVPYTIFYRPSWLFAPARRAVIVPLLLKFEGAHSP